MILGILSDTHNNETTTIAAFRLFEEHHAAHVFHCGDITSPDMLRLFIGSEAHLVFGNSDRDRSGLSQAAKYFGLLPILDVQSVELGKKQIACCHGDDRRMMNHLLASDLYDYLLIGHSHRRMIKRSRRTKIINPGALGGRNPQVPSIAIIDTGIDDVRFYRVPDGEELAPFD